MFNWRCRRARKTPRDHFYGTILGIPERKKPDNLAKRGGCWFENAAIRIHLGVEEDFRPARKAHPAIRVTGLAALKALFERKGIMTRSDEPLEGYNRFYVDDPFGNRIEFLEPL